MYCGKSIILTQWYYNDRQKLSKIVLDMVYYYDNNRVNKGIIHQTKEDKMKKVTITKTNGEVGILILSADGKWDVILNGVPMNVGGCMYYDTAQVEKIIANAQKVGSSIVIE
jgi:hypothetical protein